MLLPALMFSASAAMMAVAIIKVGSLGPGAALPPSMHPVAFFPAPGACLSPLYNSESVSREGLQLSREGTPQLVGVPPQSPRHVSQGVHTADSAPCCHLQLNSK